MTHQVTFPQPHRRPIIRSAVVSLWILQCLILLAERARSPAVGNNDSKDDHQEDSREPVDHEIVWPNNHEQCTANITVRPPN